MNDYLRLEERLAQGDGDAPGEVADELVMDQRVVQLQELLANGPVDMREAANKLLQPPDQLESLTRLIDLGVKAHHRSDSSPVLPARYHFFLRTARRLSVPPPEPFSQFLGFS